MTTEVPTHAQLMQLFQDTVLLETARLTERSFQPGFMLDILRGGLGALAEDAEFRAVKLHLATFISTAEGDDLDALARDHFQLERFGGIGAVGTIRFSRPNADFGSFLIPALTLIETADGVRFATTEEVLMTGTTIDAAIQCMTVGDVGVVGAGAITELISVLDDGTVTASNPEGTAGGVARETDPKFRERIRDFFATLRRGTRDAVVFGAKQVPGVDTAAIEETSKVADLSQTGIVSATEGSEVNGIWIAKGNRKSVKLIIVATALNMANGETVTLTGNLQDATDGGGSGAADFGAAIGPTVIDTAPGSGGPHTRTIQFEQVFDVQSARAFLRSQQTLVTSGSATITWAAILELQGTPSLVKVYIADATGTANAELIDLVEDKLVEYRAAGVEVEVLAAVVVQQAIALTVTFRAGFDTGQVRDGVIRAVFDEVGRLTIGETLFRARIVSAAGNVPGVLNVVVTNPAGDVVPAANELIRTTEATITLS